MDEKKIMNDKLYDGELKLSTAEKSKKVNGFFGTLCTLGLIATSILTLGSSLGISLAAISGAGLVGLLTKREKSLKSQEISKLDLELDHLENVNKNGLKHNHNLSLKRFMKVRELKKELKDVTKKFKKLVGKSNFCAVLSALGIGLTATVNPLFAIGTLLTFILTGSYALEAKEVNSEREHLNNRVDNIENDLDIIQKITSIQSQGNKTVNAKKKSQAVGDTKKKTIDPKLQCAIDEYVESLKNNPEKENEVIAKR